MRSLSNNGNCSEIFKTLLNWATDKQNNTPPTKTGLQSIKHKQALIKQNIRMKFKKYNEIIIIRKKSNYMEHLSPWSRKNKNSIIYP